MRNSLIVRLCLLAVLLPSLFALRDISGQGESVAEASVASMGKKNRTPMAADGSYRTDSTKSDSAKSGSASYGAVQVTSATTSQIDWTKMGQTGLNIWGALDSPDPAVRDVIATNAKNLGTKLVRVHVSWSQIQPTLSHAVNGTFNWSATDTRLDTARAKGLNILALVTGVPEWAKATNAPHGTSQDGPYNADGGRYAASFYYQLMKRYTDRYYNPTGPWNGVYAWQLLNEPNEKWRGWNPNFAGHKYTEHYAAEMLSFYNTFYHTGISSKCPGCMVINGADALNDWEAKLWLQEVMSWGMYNKVDAFAIHYYPAPQYGSTTEYQGSMAQALTLFRSHLDSYGGASLPLVITESGHASEFNGFTTQLQANYDIYNLAVAYSKGVKHFSVYTYGDWWATEAERTLGHKTAGLVAKDGTIKPAYYAVRTFTYEINDQPYLGLGTDVMSLPADIRSYRFSSARIAGGQCWVVWRTTDLNQTVGFYDPTGTKLRAAVDMYGGSLTVTRSNGYSYVVVGRNPIFLKWNP